VAARGRRGEVAEELAAAFGALLTRTR
jgi:hypothetical protein